MKTSKRSKLLLSSIAMLLVALVALGSATYAWYVVNKEVTATPISVTAAAADGLVGCKTNSSTATDWGNAVTLSGSGSLYPASIAPSALTGMYNAVGTSRSVGTYTSAGSGFDVDFTTCNAYIADDYYIKSTGATIPTVKFQVKATANADAYLNCLVFVDGTYVGGSCIDGTTTGNVNARTKTGTTESFALSALNADCGTVSNVSTTAKHVQVVVYADGENAKCTNDDVCTDQGTFTVYCYY